MTSPEGKTLLCIVGARPNFMKIAPIMASLKKLSSEKITPRLIHTGQHYDEEMKRCFFDQLGIPEPDVDLEVGSGSHAVQTAEIMRRFETVVNDEKPFAILVVGDVNSTIACALVAVKLNIPVIHVEAGLRSYDRAMPEEINRVLTDSISDMLFITERSAKNNLIREGIDESRIHFTGNVMIDTLRNNLAKATPVSSIFKQAGASDIFLREAGYGVLTLHRPSNVDDPKVLKALLETLRELSEQLPIAFTVHPRTRSCIEQAGLNSIVESPCILLLPPLAYLEMLGLMSKARIVMTDSGGMQEETTALGVPCLTLRENTERPITIDQGTNTIVGSDPDRIREEFSRIMATGGKAGNIPELWDGNAAQRIVAVIAERFSLN